MNSGIMWGKRTTNMVPEMEPKMLPIPPMMIMARWSTANINGKFSALTLPK